MLFRSYKYSNFVGYSENFTNPYWTPIHTVVTSAVNLMSASIPYRNPKLDASYMNEFFYATSNNTTAYTYYNNYYFRNWFSVAPKLNRTSSINSNVMNLLTETIDTNTHKLISSVSMGDIITQNNYWTYSLYVQPTNGGRYFLMSLDRANTTFDLSSGTVVSSTNTMYSSIKLVDTSLSVYLCQMIGQTNPIKQSLIRFTVSSDTLSMVSVDAGAIINTVTYIRSAGDGRYTPFDYVVQNDVATNLHITDYLTAANYTFDYMSLGGDYDYNTDSDYPEISEFEALANDYPPSVEDLNQIYGFEDLSIDQVNQVD